MLPNGERLCLAHAQTPSLHMAPAETATWEKRQGRSEPSQQVQCICGCLCNPGLSLLALLPRRLGCHPGCCLRPRQDLLAHCMA